MEIVQWEGWGNDAHIGQQPMGAAGGYWGDLRMDQVGGWGNGDPLSADPLFQAPLYLSIRSNSPPYWLGVLLLDGRGQLNPPLGLPERDHTAKGGGGGSSKTTLFLPL
jgi:hypothetical protein